MSSSINLAERLNNIHKELESLKYIIPNDPVKDDDQFSSINDKIGLIDADINQAKDLIIETRQKALQKEDKSRERIIELFEKAEEKILEDAAFLKVFEVSYDHLDQPSLKLCFLLLSIFPENAIIKRRPLIYWWIGEGLITSEEEGENILEELLKLGLIMPYGNGKSPHVNKCKVHPWIRYMSISLARKARLFNDLGSGATLSNSESSIISRRVCLTESLSQKKEWNHKNLSTIFNLDMKNVSFDFLQAKSEKLVVLQLGQWQHHSKHHAELKSGVIPTEVGAHRHLKYLGLRKISMLFSLPPAICNLVNLEILDLKACYNLEKLPPRISSLKKLTHLDVSECYFLESMPRGIDKLTSLHVLKGYVMGRSNPTCKISLLKNLMRLKRLSIHIAEEDMKNGKEFDELNELKSVQCLKITWVPNFPQNSIESFSFPANLEKLELENLPHDSMPKWLYPQALESLKQLCIKGGRLSSLNRPETMDRWNKVELLYLKYLRNLRIGLKIVKKLFPNLKYVQNFHEEGHESSRKNRSYLNFEWSKEASH